MFDSLNSMLAFGILLGLFHILLAATLVTASRGMGWALGNRDGEPPPVSPLAKRAQRAAWNFLETFPFLAAALVCARAIGRQGDMAELGVQIWFWARVVYLPVYLAGIPVIRSVVWAVSLVGLLMVVMVIM